MGINDILSYFKLQYWGCNVVKRIRINKSFARSLRTDVTLCKITFHKKTVKKSKHPFVIKFASTEGDSD